MNKDQLKELYEKYIKTENIVMSDIINDFKILRQEISIALKQAFELYGTGKDPNILNLIFEDKIIFGDWEHKNPVEIRIDTNNLYIKKLNSKDPLIFKLEWIPEFIKFLKKYKIKGV